MMSPRLVTRLFSDETRPPIVNESDTAISAHARSRRGSWTRLTLRSP